ncbi:MAG: DUF1178 family protein [Gemmobacter sp.]
MIRFTLHCDQGHDFESWFASGTAFDDLKARGLVSCAVCGSAQVEKALMAPAVATKTAEPARPLSTPTTPAEEALAALRREIETRSEYVGVNFVTEARKIHAGNAPERPIYGEAKPDEARKLIEDGVPVAPLPFMPGRKVS